MLSLRPLGRTGIMVSPLGLGTVKLGRDRDVKYPGAFQIPDDTEAADLLRAAQRMGVMVLDTAPAYGEAEERLGRILPACGGRDRWVIITKAGEEFDGKTGESRFDFSAGAIRASVERSLERLKTDRVEALLLHSDGRDRWIIGESGAVEALARLKKQGKARTIGISTKTAAGGMLAATCGMFDVVMLTLNVEHGEDLPAIREAGRRGVGVFIKKALSSGRDADVAGAMRRCLAEPAVTSVIVGTTRSEHLGECAMAVEGMRG
jgi:aryl-alcohol dehydrogenase-like predicted oxidoreductase